MYDKTTEQALALEAKKWDMENYREHIYRYHLKKEEVDGKTVYSTSAGPSNFEVKLNGAFFYIRPINGQTEEGIDTLLVKRIPRLKRIGVHAFSFGCCVIEAFGYREMELPKDCAIRQAIELVLMSTLDVRMQFVVPTE